MLPGSPSSTALTAPARGSAPRLGVRARIATTVGGFAAVALATVALAPTLGSTPIDLGRALDQRVPWAENVDAQILFIARIPRVLAGALVGAALAAAGVVLQALLRNALATPYTLGVSSGAALGAMLAIAGRLESTRFGAVPVMLASLMGALVATALVYLLAARRRRGLSTIVLLLAGVTLNAFFSALVTFVQYLSDPSDWFRAARWLLGNLDVSGYDSIVAALPLLLVSAAMLATLPRALDLLSMGAESAATRGVDVRRVQHMAFLSASLATGAAVSLAGPIGFVGIIVPHLVRLLVGADHRLVLPASALFGAAFLVWCDLAARTVLAPVELPVGVITAMIGGPFFLWLLLRRG